MKMSALSPVLLSLVLLGAGCAAKNEAPAPTAPRTSYPSPDYPPQAAAPQAPVPPAERTATSQATAPVAQATPPMAPAGGSPRPDGPPRPGMLFDMMDTDRNGRVTLEEWRAFQDKAFRRMDKNNDNVLTREEMAASLPPRHGPGGPGGPGPRPAQ
uniref:EF-hand domain-containing protein n=1 Tax=Desulfovibrio sp. U5L TaxID=596152 RepID=I2Q473_9BACT